MGLWNWIKENKKTIFLCTCAACAPFTGGATLAGLTLSAGTCSALAVGGAFIVGQGMDQETKRKELEQQALNNQTNLINTNNQEYDRKNNELDTEKRKKKEIEDAIKDIQDKLNDPNTSAEDKERYKANLALFQTQLDDSERKINSLNSEISNLTNNLKDLKNLSNWNPFKGFSLSKLTVYDKLLIVAAIILIIFLLKG